jgi:hypothetical protein
MCNRATCEGSEDAARRETENMEGFALSSVMIEPDNLDDDPDDDPDDDR